ncbi:MAG: cyclase family protein, partial [Solirubrobacteraceae bacterium]
AALLPAGAGAQRRRGRRRGRVVDLTHRFTAGFPLYTGDEPTRRTLFTIGDNGFYSQEWTFGEHSGTHLDAPGHFVTGGRLVDELRPRELVLPIVVIDISSRARQDPDVVLSPRHLRRFERRHGRIPRGALVAMDSGWARKIGDEDEFKGTDAGGTYHFPGFGEEAVEWLLAERRAAAIGVDTLSLDHGPSRTFGVHTMWLGADNYGIENLANLDRLPPTGAVATVGVIPWERGSGGPARVLATY